MATTVSGVRKRGPGRPPNGPNGQKSIAQMLAEVGTTGTKNFSGILLDEYLPQLSFYNAATVYNQMRRSDATVGALLAAYTMPIRATKWYVQPNSESDQDLSIADFMHDNLWGFGSQTFDDFLRESLTMFDFGFSWFEKIFAYIEDGPHKGMIGWDHFAYRYQNTRFRWNTEIVSMNGAVQRQLKTVTQFAPPDYRMVDIPVEKLLIFSRQKEGDNFDGISLLRNIYQSWFIKSKLYLLQAIGLERAAVGVPYAKWLQHVDTETISIVTQMLENLRADDQAFVQFDGNEVEIGYLVNKFMATDLHMAIDHHDTQMMKGGLAQFVNLGTRSTGATGSYALSQDQSQMFLDALNGEANYFSSAFHLQAVIQLLSFNFPNVWRGDFPRLSHGDIGERSAVKMAQALNAFAQYGFVTTDPHTENVIREFLDLPPRDEEYRLMQAQQALLQTTYPEGDNPNNADDTPIPQVAPPGSNPAGVGSQPGAGVQSPGNGAGNKGGAGKQSGAAGKPGARTKSLNSKPFGSKQRGGLAANEDPYRVDHERNYEKHREQAYQMFMSELQSLKGSVNHRPLKPSEAMARGRRAYVIGGY